MRTDGGALHFDAVINNIDFNKQIAEMERRILGLSNNAVQQTSQMDAAFSKLSLAVAGFFSAQAASDFVRELINVRGEFQQIETSFRTMLKSKSAADQLMREAIELAAVTPFGLKDVASGAKQLLAYGTAAKDIAGTLTMLGNVASGVSSPIGDIVYLYGTLQTQGRAYAKDIQQFTGRGIPIIKELAKQFGVAESEVMRLVESGKVGFPEVQKAFQSMTSESGMFFNLMQEQSKNLTGRIANLGDAWDMMLNDIGQSNDGLLSGSIEAAITLVENYEKVLSILGVLTATYGAYKAAVIAVAVVERIRAASQVVDTIQRFNGATMVAVQVTRQLTAAQTVNALATNASSKATAILNRTMLANPYVLVATAVLGLGAAMWALHDSTTAQEKAQKELNDENQKSSKAANELKARINDLNAIVRDEAASNYQRNRAYKEMQALYPSLFGNISREAFLKLEAAEAQKRVNEANDQNSLRDLSARYKSAQEEVSRLTSKLKAYQAQQALLGNQSAGISSAISSTAKQLEVARIKAQELGVTFKDQSEALKVSLMTDKEKLTYYQKQKDELIKQKGAMSAMYTFSGLLNESFSSYSLSNLTNQIDEASKKIQTLRDGLSGKSAPARTIAVIDAEIQENREAQKNTATRAAYAQIEQEILRLEAEKTAITGALNKTEKKQADERLQALEAIRNAEKEAYRETLTQNESEIQAVKDKYDELRKEARKAGLGAGSLARIDKVEKQVTGNLRYEQETERLKVELEKQKGIFSKYEEYKISVSKSAADKRFKGEKAGFDNYGEYLKSEISKVTAQANKGQLTGPMQSRLLVLSQLLTEFNTGRKEKQDQDFQEAYLATLSYEGKKIAIHKKYNDMALALGKDLTDAQKELLLEQRNDALKDLDETNAQKLTKFYKGMQDMLDVSKEAVKAQIQSIQDLLSNSDLTSEMRLKLETELKSAREALKAGENASKATQLSRKKSELLVELDKLVKAGLSNTETFKKLRAELDALNASANQTAEDGVKKLLARLSQVFSASARLGEGLANLGATISSGGLISAGALLSGIASQAEAIMAAFDPDASDFDRMMSGINGLITMVDTVISSAAERKNALEDYYRSVIQLQNDYNLSLNDQIRLQSILDEGVFLKNYTGRITDGIKSAADAQKGLNEEMAKLAKGQAISGKRNAVDWGNVGKSTAAGAAVGTAIAPIIGTAIGAVAGFIGGLFGGKKKVDTFVPVLKEYPELIKMMTDGTVSFNAELAKSLVANNLVDEATKAILNNILDWQKKLDEARQQIKDVVSELAGSLGNDLRNALVDAFKSGEDAASAFGTSVNKVLENILSNLLFNAVFSDAFKKLEEDMVKSFDPLTGDGNLIDDFGGFFENMPDLVEKFNKALEEARGEAAKSGLDIFGKNSKAASGITGAFQRQVTEQTASELTGLYRANYDLSKRQYAAIEQLNLAEREQANFLNRQIMILSGIEQNTGRTADNTDRLKAIEDTLTTIATNTKPSQTSRDLGY